MHQSRARPLEPAERALADALEAIFKSGEQDFAAVAQALEDRGVKRPSGKNGPWSTAVLEQELASINASLDEAYAKNGIGA
jgi:Recombinase-like helix-turn-helix domain